MNLDVWDVENGNAGLVIAPFEIEGFSNLVFEISNEQVTRCSNSANGTWRWNGEQFEAITVPSSVTVTFRDLTGCSFVTQSPSKHYESLTTEDVQLRAVEV